MCSELQVMHKVCTLAFVWSNDAYLIGTNARLQEPGEHLLNVGGLGAVEI